MKTEGQVLAEMIESTRGYTRWHLSLLKEVDVYKTFEYDGKTYNPVIWEIGHLVTSENFLAFHLTGGEMTKIKWARLFGLGAPIPAKEGYPPYEEIWNTFKSIHEAVIKYVSGLTDEQLDAPSTMEFAGITTVRGSIQHLIRHEGAHIGHLGWLCKMHGIKTI